MTTKGPSSHPMTYFANRQNVGSKRVHSTSSVASRQRSSLGSKRTIRMATADSRLTAGEDGGGNVPYGTILISVWTFLTAWWSVFTPPDRTFGARILLFQPLWIIRMFRNDKTWLSDLFLVLTLHGIFSLVSGAWISPSLSDLWGIDLENKESRVYLQVFALLGLCGGLAGMIVHRDTQLSDEDVAVSSPARERRIDEHPLPPLLIPSRTTHSRMFPKKNAFSYSYLYVGIPVGFTGKISKALSIDASSPAWFNVKTSEYLYRGDDHLSLGEKLKSYLHTQGVTDRDYAFAYLVTAPRFLGYSFNPVSFWYLYDSDLRLQYMVLEVNNTFDERRLYLLKRSHPEKETTEAENGSVEAPKNSTLFAESWPKDFHVSPFNSRKGSYSLRAVDPLTSYQEKGHVTIDNTIVLRSSKEHPKLVARVFSSTTPSSALTITTPQLASFIAQWWWVGFMTFPRILYQAGILFFSTKLSVFYRPEVTPASIGRSYTPDEVALEPLFAAFLALAVESSTKPLRLNYRRAHPPSHNSDPSAHETVFYSPNFTYEEAHSRTITLTLLSPAFYSRLPHYAHLSEAFDREALTPELKSRTLSLDPQPLLPVLLEAMNAITPRSPPTPSRNPLEPLRWRLLYALRCPPAAPAYRTSPDTPTTSTDIRALPPSPMDLLLQSSPASLTKSPKAPPGQISASMYRRICTKLFLAQRLTLGLPALISILDLCLRGAMILAALVCASRTDVFDVLRPREYDLEDWVAAGVVLGVANAVHLWEFVKG